MIIRKVLGVILFSLLSFNLSANATLILKAKADSLDIVLARVEDSLSVKLKEINVYYQEDHPDIKNASILGCDAELFHSGWRDHRSQVATAKANLYEGGTMYGGTFLIAYIEETENRIRYLRDFIEMLD